jgi:hypothetical protein
MPDFKLNSSHIAEIARSFHPKAQQGNTLPDPKMSRDLQEAVITNPDGTITEYRMVNGVWKKRGNLT